SYTALLASLLACSYAFLWPFAFCLSLVFFDSIQILNKFLFFSVILATSMFHHQVSLCVPLPFVFSQTSSATDNMQSFMLFHSLSLSLILVAAMLLTFS